jgi:hypothetical protein
LRFLKGLIFFGKRDLAFGISLPERSEIWKTFFGGSDGCVPKTLNPTVVVMKSARDGA